jgi:hypothetical protein
VVRTFPSRPCTRRSSSQSVCRRSGAYRFADVAGNLLLAWPEAEGRTVLRMRVICKRVAPIRQIDTSATVVEPQVERRRSVPQRIRLSLFLVWCRPRPTAGSLATLGSLRREYPIARTVVGSTVTAIAAGSEVEPGKKEIRRKSCREKSHDSCLRRSRRSLCHGRHRQEEKEADKERHRRKWWSVGTAVDAIMEHIIFPFLLHTRQRPPRGLVGTRPKGAIDQNLAKM